MIANLILVLLLAPAGAAPSSGTSAARQAQAEYLRGTLLEHRGAYAEALAAYETAMKLDPSAAFIAGEAAELALQLEDRPRAEKWARKRLELAPGDAKSRVILGRVLWARGDMAGAEAELARALKDDPSSADTLFALTELVAGRDPKRARKLLEDFLKDNPDHAARALFELGRLDAQDERYADAVEKLKRSIDLDNSESDPARLALAQVYEVTQATPAAVAQYQRLLSDDPDDAELQAHIGELQAAMGSDGDARATFARIKEKHPGDPAACAWLAGDAERAGDFARAAAALRDSAALKDDPTLNLRLGYYQLQAGSMKDAMATLTEARKRWPNDDRVAYYLALGHDDLGEYAPAVALLREVLASKPDDRDARWQLATILEKMDKIGEAEPEFRRLIADKPDDAPSLNYLGYSLADRGLKLNEAAGLIDRALAVEPSNPAYRDSLGWVLYKLGRSTEAVHELAVSARALPDDDSVWDHLGDARKALGREEAAWRAWRLAQSFGGTKAGAKADALQKGLGDEAIGQLWRAHLEAVHGGVRRFSGLCEIKGKIRGQTVSQQALLTFHAPLDLTLEILGPLFLPVARAHVDAHGFTMDRFPVDGLTDDQVHGATEGILSLVAATLAGEPYLPGPAKLDGGWGRRALIRPGWRVDIGDNALARAVAPAGGASLELTDFDKSGTRRVPKAFSASGHFWDFSLSCASPKIETEPDPGAVGNPVKFQCPAKVNLFLEVTGRRKDGYHTLATLFAKVNIYDVLDMEFANGGRPILEIVDELDTTPLSAGPDNLVLRAAEAFYKTFRIGVGVKITLIKRIPMGAGLGGGSSDAAGTLLGLAKMFSIELTAAHKKKLHDIGVKLGADVPFFLKDANFCRATGIGDNLKPIKIAKSLPYMIIAWPGFGVPTGPVYAALPPRRRPETLTRLSQLSRLIRGLKRGRPVEEWGGLLFNRMEQADLPVMAQVAQARRILEAAGAKGTRMSGSGSSVFGFVSSHVEGEKVIRRLKAYPWKVYLTSCHG